MPSRPRLLPIAALVCVLSCAAPGAFAARSRASADEPSRWALLVEDARIGFDVRQALLDTLGEEGLDIEIAVDGGRVRLAGPVGSDEAVARALRAARSVRGVRGVDDELTVTPRRRAVPGRTPGEVGDARLEAQVKSRLVRAFGIQVLRLQVEAEAGAVSLAGAVGRDEHREQALAVAQQVPGVVRVTDLIRVDRSLRRALRD